MGTVPPSSPSASSVLPTPKTLEAYKAISSETHDAILAAFKSELAHQQKLAAEESERKTKALEAEIAFARRGQIFGLVIGMTAIISGALIACLGREWAGGFIGGGGVIGLVSVFVIGHVRGRESADKLDMPESAAPVS